MHTTPIIRIFPGGKVPEHFSLIKLGGKTADIGGGAKTLGQFGKAGGILNLSTPLIKTDIDDAINASRQFISKSDDLLGNVDELSESIKASFKSQTDTITKITDDLGKKVNELEKDSYESSTDAELGILK